MANPFITQANQMTGQTLIDPESQALQRQKQYAAALLQQNQQPQGQMVGGRYVAPSWTQQLNAVLNPLLGAYMLDKADTKLSDINLQNQELARKNIADALRLSKGGEETVYGAGMEGPTMEVKQIAPDSNAAIAKLLRPNATAMESTLGGKLLERQFKDAKWEKVERLNSKGDTVAGMVDVNSPQPELTFREIGVSKPALSQKDIIDFRDRGINVGGGMPSSGMPMGGQGGGQGGAKVTGDAKFMPSNLPVYENDPNLSPQQNREAAGKFSEELRKNVKNAKGTFDLLKDASSILNTGSPSSGMLESMATGTKRFFGQGGETSKADQRLNMIAGALTMTQPRFEGPQGVLDVKLYEKQAGDLGNPNLPIADRLAAVQQMINLQKKYYPNGDWDSIDISGPVMTKQTFFKGEKRFDPVTFRQGLKPQDQEAFDWVRKNPNDPRSNEIKQRLGIQ
jgi:hypothetical protein